ncbi:hypothetical protein QYE76_002324 [Lolium multiflorum]|uniref:Integrase catalytic domain-containing protein n=1 Tax=Lolium multiflorum TaxID=4521 RepID=A0AAD8VZE9_LOLMU|nr:hypothetical protein QYE76_002324 [Lolium multiflorum]
MSTPSSNPFADSSIPDPGQLRAVAIADHVPVKLSTTAANYLAWKTYFYLLFREYNLRDHIDGTADLLARDSDWLAIDATIIRWLFLTVSPDIFKTVVREGDDARTVWGKINGLFTNNKLQRVVFLQQEFFVHPRAIKPWTPLRLKAISDELQDLGFRIGDELLLSTLTAGLNEDLGNAASNLTLMTNPTFERAVDYLRLEERRLKGVRTRAVHTALWAGGGVLPHGGGAPPHPPLHTPRLNRHNTKEEGPWPWPSPWPWWWPRRWQHWRPRHRRSAPRFGRPILALQTDNGKEFDNTTIRTLLSTHGTIFRLTCPYTSQQNGRAERVLRTLNDCVRTLLFHAHMPPQFWPDALSTATLLVNLRPSPPPPPLINSHLAPFRASFSVTRLTPKATVAMIRSLTVITSRHVYFDEHCFPFAQKGDDFSSRD